LNNFYEFNYSCPQVATIANLAVKTADATKLADIHVFPQTQHQWNSMFRVSTKTACNDN